MAKSYPSIETLISPGALEEDGCNQFIRNFEKAYTPPGSACPPFHAGKLADAIETAWSRPTPDMKLLVMYLHREGNPLTRRFSRILWSGMVSQLLEAHCVLWGWDVTAESNEKTLLRIASNNLGYDNAWRLQLVGKLLYPCFIFLTRTDKKPGIELVQFLKVSADLEFSVALFANAVHVFTDKIRPTLMYRERNRSGRLAEDTMRGRSNEPERERLVAQGRPKSPPEKKMQKGRTKIGRVESDDSFSDDLETIETLYERVDNRTSRISGKVDPPNQTPSNYPYHIQDEVAKKRLAELKKQYLEAEHERLKAEKKAIFSRLLQQEEIVTDHQPSTSMMRESKSNDSRDSDLRKKVKPHHSEHKRHSARPTSKSKPDDGELITLRFRSYKEVFEKKFKSDDTFEKLLLFLSARGYSFREFKILAGWPRVDISQEDSRTPLKHLDFHMRDNVILEKRKLAHPYIV